MPSVSANKITVPITMIGGGVLTLAAIFAAWNDLKQDNAIQSLRISNLEEQITADDQHEADIYDLRLEIARLQERLSNHVLRGDEPE